MNFEKPIIKDPTPDQEGDERLAEAQQERVNELAGKMSSSPNEEWHVLSVERSDDKIFVTGPHDLKEDAIVFEDEIDFGRAMAAAGFYKRDNQWRIDHRP